MRIAFYAPLKPPTHGTPSGDRRVAGLPVASCALRGVPDVVIDGRTGLLAPAGDAAGLAQRIRTLLVDQGARRSLGQRAAEFVDAERGLDAAARCIGGALAALTKG